MEPLSKIWRSYNHAVLGYCYVLIVTDQTGYPDYVFFYVEKQLLGSEFIMMVNESFPILTIIDLEIL